MTPKNTDSIALQQKQAELDLKFMDLALKWARVAETKGEVPIAAIIVDENGEIVAKATTLREQTHSVLGHAELVALHRANKKRNSWRLNNLTLYVTLEPCLMCAAALVQSRVKRVVFGTFDPKGGGVGSLTDLSQDKRLNHQFEVTSGIRASECQELLQNFFRKKRKQKNKF